MSNKIKKVVVGASLGVSALLLSACGESSAGNPMLEKGVPEYLAGFVQHPFIFFDYMKVCIKNFSDPPKYGPVSRRCEEWIKDEYNVYIDVENHKEQKLPGQTPTFEEFKDPKVWKIVNQIINGKNHHG